jgi:hypothetical protein
MRATGSPAPPPAGPPPIDHMAHEHRTGRRFRPGRWLLVGLGLVLVALAFYLVFSPVTTKGSEPSCSDRPAIVAAFGSPTASSAVPSNREWCRREARDQLASAIFGLAFFGVLILASAASSAWRARRAPKEPPEDAAADVACPTEDLVLDVERIARPPHALDPVGPSRMFSGRLVAASNYHWLVVEDRPGHSTLLVTGKSAGLPFLSREFEVAGDTSRRVTFQAPGADMKFTARPDRLDRFHHWWTARSRDHTTRGRPSTPTDRQASLPSPSQHHGSRIH